MNQQAESIGPIIEQAGMLLGVYEQHMNGLAEEAQQQLDRAVWRQKEEISGFVRENVKAELDTVLKGYAADMEAVRGKMLAQAAEFNTYLYHVNRKNRQLLFMSWLAVAVSLIVLLAGGAWLSCYYLRVINENRIDAEVAKLIAQSEVVRCGDNLCAKMEKNRQNGYAVIVKK